MANAEAFQQDELVKFEDKAWENLKIIENKARECLLHPIPVGFRHQTATVRGERVYIKTS